MTFQECTRSYATTASFAFYLFLSRCFLSCIAGSLQHTSLDSSLLTNAHSGLCLFFMPTAKLVCKTRISTCWFRHLWGIQVCIWWKLVDGSFGV